mgnify:CR=1 FL=1
MKIAIIGTGVCGLVCARELYQGHQLTAFAMWKKAGYPGYLEDRTG